MKDCHTFAAVLALSLAICWAPQAASDSPNVADVVFSEIEKRIIDRYYQRSLEESDRSAYRDKDPARKKKHKNKKDKGKKKGMPPGLAKRGALPPGLAKREMLPPGLARRELPEDLIVQLPPPPLGTERVVVDDNVVLVEKATGTVLDILEHILVAPQ